MYLLVARFSGYDLGNVREVNVICSSIRSKVEGYKELLEIQMGEQTYLEKEFEEKIKLLTKFIPFDNEPPAAPSNRLIKEGEMPPRSKNRQEQNEWDLAYNKWRDEVDEEAKRLVCEDYGISSLKPFRELNDLLKNDQYHRVSLSIQEVRDCP